MERRGTFDYILLETTGLADPGNIAPIFWVDDGLGSSIYLDGIVTLVDAQNVLRSLDDPLPKEELHEGHDSHLGPPLTTAHLQISHADAIIINKSDLVSGERLRLVDERIRGINGIAKTHVTDHSKVPQLDGVVLDLHSYDAFGDIDFQQKGHSHLDPSISTITLTLSSPGPSKMALDAWLRPILWESCLPPKYLKSNSETSMSSPRSPIPSFEIHRLKGVIPQRDGSSKIIQGVREIFEIIDAKGAPHSGKDGKIVLIGRGLQAWDWQKSLEDTRRIQ